MDKNDIIQDTEPMQQIEHTAPPEPLFPPRHKRIARVRTVGKPANHTVIDNRLELLITTVNRSKAEYFLDLLQSFDINMQFVTFGNGTADAKMLARFGLTGNEKAVIFSVIQGNNIPAAISLLEEKFRTIKNGNGIAYTVPLSGVIGTLIFRFLGDIKDGQ